MSERLAYELVRAFDTPEIEPLRKHGWSKLFVGKWLLEFDKTGGCAGVTACPVQIDVSHGIGHSFLRLQVDGEVWLYDHIGFDNFAPYLGLEIDAPFHLQNYRLDTFMENDRLTKR